MGDKKNVLRENVPRAVSTHCLPQLTLCVQEFSEIHFGLFEAAPGLLGLSIPLSFCPSRTYNRPGVSSKCPSVLLLPIYYGTTGWTPRPSNQWAALPQWHQWTGLCQWATCEQGLPCSCHGLPRLETTATLPGGASAGNTALRVWASPYRPPWREWLGCLLGLPPFQPLIWSAGPGFL